MVNNGNDALSLEAIRILGMGFGEEDTPDILSPRFQSPNAEIRRAAVDAYLPYLSKDNYKPLLNLIWDENEELRRRAFMEAQQYMDASDKSVLEKAAQHEDEAIRDAAAQILKKSKAN